MSFGAITVVLNNSSKCSPVDNRKMPPEEDLGTLRVHKSYGMPIKTYQWYTNEASFGDFMTLYNTHVQGTAPDIKKSTVNGGKPAALMDPADVIRPWS